jgi:hypothetical protein
LAYGQGKISTTSYRYTFALSPAFADQCRPKLVEITTANNEYQITLVERILGILKWMVDN